MAKRYYDTEVFKKPWFRKLLPKYKALWFWILSICDHAGFFSFDEEMASFTIGEDISKDDLKVYQEHIFVNKNNNDNYWLSKFCDFQYGELSENNNVHKSVLKLLSKSDSYQTLARPYPDPFEGAKDKDKEKAQEKDKEKALVKKIDLSNTEAVEPLPKKTTTLDFRTQIENIYALYPRKEGKKRGMEILLKQIKNQADLDNLKKSVINYSSRVKNDENTFIKHFSTFAGVWTDYLDDTAETQPNKELKGTGYDGRALIAMLDKNREKYKRKKQWEDFFYEKTGKPLYPDYIPYDIRMQAIDQEEAENDRQQQL